MLSKDIQGTIDEMAECAEIHSPLSWAIWMDAFNQLFLQSSEGRQKFFAAARRYHTSEDRGHEYTFFLQEQIKPSDVSMPVWRMLLTSSDSVPPDRFSRSAKSVHVAICSPDGEILVADHPEGRVDIFGGKSDPAELPIDTAVREVYEELGILINPNHLHLLPTPDQHRLMYVYITKKFSVPPDFQRDKFLNYRWINVLRLDPESDIGIFSRLPPGKINALLAIPIEAYSANQTDPTTANMHIEQIGVLYQAQLYYRRRKLERETHRTLQQQQQTQLEAYRIQEQVRWLLIIICSGSLLSGTLALIQVMFS